MLYTPHSLTNAEDRRESSLDVTEAYGSHRACLVATTCRSISIRGPLGFTSQGSQPEFERQRSESMCAIAGRKLVCPKVLDELEATPSKVSW